MKTSQAGRLRKALGLLTALLLAGCEQAADETSTANEQNSIPAALMQVISLEKWQEISQQYQGKVLVADLWASWCVSCIERFPAMVQLSEQYAGKPVQFVSLNLDAPDDAEAIDWSNRFLAEMKAQFPHYHLNENLMYSFEQLDLLGIPVVLIFDQQGTEAFRLTGDNPNLQFSEADVEKAILELIHRG